MKTKKSVGVRSLRYILLFSTLLIFVLITTLIKADEIFYCSNAISICSASAPGKGEASDGTIDNCADGTEADTLAYVKNLTIRDLNNTKFYIGDTVEIYGLFGCSASNDGFRYAFIYNYGNYTLNSGNAVANWSTLVTADCDANSDVTLYYNLTLPNIVGNHTIRGLITYKYKATLGCTVPTNLTCGSSHNDDVDCFSSRWSETDDITFLVLDNQVPNVTLLYPLNNSWAASVPINFNFTATDNRDAISNCTLFTNFSGTFQANATIRSPANNSNQNISARPSDGNYTWNIQCVDNSTNSNFSVSNFTIRVDTTFPKVEFVSPTPANGSFQSNRTVTINISINESNRANVTFNWNGSNSTTLDNAYGIFWNITNTSLNGTYSIYVFVNDSAGNANTTITRQFTIDTVAPGLFVLISPANSSMAGISANLSPLLNWSATTEENFKNYSIEFSDNASFPYVNRSFLTTGNVSNTTFKITENLANNVTWFWRVIAYDKAGNLNRSNQTFVYITNTSEPSVTLNYPPNNYISKFVNTSFNHTPSDTDLSRCQLVANFSGTWTHNVSDGSPVSGVVNNIANISLNDSVYIWNVNCTDNQGFTAFAPSNFTLTVDLTFPKVEFLNITPANNSAQSATSITINISINESNRHTIILSFNGTNDSGAFTNDFSIYWSVTQSSLDGTYDFYVFVNDTAGNSNTTKTRRVTIDSLAPTIVNETAAPRGANNNSLFNITAVITDNFRVNSTIAEIEKPDTTKENLTMNISSGDIYSAIFNGTTNGTFSVIIYANDTVNNQRQSSRFNFTVDITKPTIQKINHTPSSTDAIDPNVSINVSVTVTDNFLVDTVLILYKKDTDVIWTNTTASNVSSLYWGNFTPNNAGNWSFAVWSNDTSGNVNISANTTLNVSFDFTWNITPTELGVVGGVKGTNNVVLGNVTINNTGEFTMNFTLSKKSGVPSVSFNISNINVSNHSTEVVRVLADAPSTAATYVIDIYVNSTNQSASPQSRVVNATFSVTEGGPFLFLQILKSASSVAPSATTDLNAKLTNTGNDTCVNGIADWTLPSDWKILAGLTGERNISLGDLSVGASAYHNISVQVGTTTGDYIITIAGNCSNGGVNNTLSQSVTVTGGGGGGSSGSSGGGGGSSGGGGGGASNVKGLEVKTFASVLAGSTVSVDIDNKNIAFTKIAANVNKELKSVQIEISSLKEKPVTQSAAAAVYQYLEVVKFNIAENDLNRLTLSFRTPKTWLDDNALIPNDITLYRYEQQQWNALQTKITDGNDVDVFYEADSPGFSFFAIGTKPGIEPGILFAVDETIEIVRGQSKSIIVNITNRKVNATLIDLKPRIDGFASTQVQIFPESIAELSFNNSTYFNITINVPSYMAEKKYPLKLFVTGKRQVGYGLEDISFFKNLTLIVFRTLRSQVEFCLIEAEKEMAEMELKDFNVQKVSPMLNDAKQALNESEYGKAKEICDVIRSLNSKAFKTYDEINALKEKIEELKAKGFDMGSAEKSVELALGAFNEGDFEKAENLIQETRLIVTLQVQAEEASILNRLRRLIVNYWWVLILTLLLASALGLVAYNRYSVASIKKRIKDLGNEEKSILDLMKKSQNEYFVDKMLSRTIYEKYMEKYRKRLAKIRQEAISLKAKRVGMLKLSQNKEDLQNEKNEIDAMMKDLQRQYFEEKVISKNFYDKIMSELKKRIAEIEKNMLIAERKEEEKLKKESKKDLEKKDEEKLWRKKISAWLKNWENIKNSLRKKEKDLISAKEHIEGKEKIQERLIEQSEEKISEKEHQIKAKPIISKSNIKHNILKHLKEAYKHER